MRLKFILGDGHRSVDISDYRFTSGSSPSICFVKTHKRDYEPDHETVDITGDVFVMNDRGDTIDRLTYVNTHSNRKEGK